MKPKDNKTIFEDDDNFDVKITVSPKIDIKKLFKDKVLKIKSFNASLKVHKDIDDTTSFDAEAKADLKKVLNGESDGIKKACFMFNKKF